MAWHSNYVSGVSRAFSHFLLRHTPHAGSQLGGSRRNSTGAKELLIDEGGDFGDPRHSGYMNEDAVWC